jgi:hypothetical protein
MSEPIPEWLRRPGAGAGGSPGGEGRPRSGDFRRHEAGQSRTAASKSQRQAQDKRTQARELGAFFSDLDLNLRRPGEFWNDDDASEAQLAFLAKVGIDASGISKGGCARIIEHLHKRRQEGLATFKQVRLLVRMKHPAPATVSFSAAQTYITAELEKGIRREGNQR